MLKGRGLPRTCPTCASILTPEAPVGVKGSESDNLGIFTESPPYWAIFNSSTIFSHFQPFATVFKYFQPF